MPDIGYVDGRFMSLAEATVPVEDRGYQFGDGVYEVVRTYGGIPFRLEAHVARLERSARAINVPLPFGISDCAGWVAEGIRLAGYPECKVYVQLTRGVAPRDHRFPSHVSPTFVMTVREMTELDPEIRSSGVNIILVEDVRWGRCDIKSINLLPNVMAKEQAGEAGAFEAVFVRGGEVAEGAVSNVMACRSGVLVTPPSGTRILSGVTREIVLDLARKENIPVEERSLGVQELQEAEEVFLTGTTVEILPVVFIDQKPVGTGTPGKVTNLLSRRFRGVVG